MSDDPTTTPDRFEPSADLRALPKVELHVHLEGTIDAQVASELARGHGQDPDDALRLVDGDYPRRFRDFDHFVDVFLATSRQVRTPDDLATVAAAFVRGQAAQNVLWTEATLTAGTFVANGMRPEDLWAALRDGFAEEPDVHVGLIIDSVRELGPDNAAATVRLVEDADAPIVGLGLTGIEGSVHESAFGVLRTAADQLGLGIVVHAGETGGPDNVRAALDDLGADRIAHGIAAMQDPDLVTRMVADRVPTDVCPSSNVQLGIVEDLDHHPVIDMLDAGMSVTISSDDPPFFSTTLTEELDHVMRRSALLRRDLADLQRRAIDVSFAPEPVRRQARARIDAWAATTIV